MISGFEKCFNQPTARKISYDWEGKKGEADMAKKAKSPRPITVFRSAKTGVFVAKKFAKRYKATTEKEYYKAKK